MRMAAETSGARIAIIRLVRESDPRVTAMKTGTVSIGSITAKKK